MLLLAALDARLAVEIARTRNPQRLVQLVESNPRQCFPEHSSIISTASSNNFERKLQQIRHI